jgi:hypothetical protein
LWESPFTHQAVDRCPLQADDPDDSTGLRISRIGVAVGCTSHELAEREQSEGAAADRFRRGYSRVEPPELPANSE